jgi:beta-glucosidase
MINRFPEGFLWGAATSAHQVEGNNTNSDWWRAEQRGRVPYKSGRACDSYHRYEEDFDLAKSMHNNTHRFSLEWSRIEPEEGEFKKEEVEHYRAVIRAVKERGMEPFVTLHHFTNPVWFTDKGGWADKKAPEYFERYAHYVAQHLGGEARFWITINEPHIVLSAGYLSGRWPPFQPRNLLGYWRGLNHMVEAHKRAYRALHREGVEIVRISIYHKNIWFLRKIKHHQDFIGLNYYNHFKISLVRGLYQDGKEYNDFGWEIYPRGLYHVLKGLQDFNKPIYVTENGISDTDDDQRPQFIKNHAQFMHHAIQEGMDVRGYFYWSLLDNFEWSAGFTQRFGLVEVDFSTQKRTPRKSATIYSNFCERNAVN